ncbi:DNA polymerase III subunit gamma/tau [bacterium]|nr:DNA polymerase III subunit gamma/tau [bacterium]
MSYLVLARKWRPQRFDDIVGQPHISQTLKNAIKEKRVAHAFLFCGMRGIGKTTTARILAKALNCHNAIDNEPCCKCPSCIQISNGNSMDVIEIDGASNNSVDDIRELREKVKFKPNHGKYKVYIIDEVHQLSNQAFNALLKTLEEPPEHIIFIFATTEAHKIPMTILSRCQRYNFKKIGETDMKQLLKKIAASEKLTLDEESISIITWASEGSMRDSQSFLDQAIAYCGENIQHDKLSEILGIIDRKFIAELYTSIASGDRSKIFEHVENIVSAGYNIAHLQDKLIEYNRDLTLAKLSKDGSNLLDLPKVELETMQKIAKNFTLMQLQQFHRILVDSEYQIKKSSHPRISLEMMLLKLTMVETTVSIKEILQKIEEISKKTAPDIRESKKEITHPPIPKKEKSKPSSKLEYQEDGSPESEEEQPPVYPEVKPPEVKKSELFERMLGEFEAINGPYKTVFEDAENVEINGKELILIYGPNSEFFDESADENFRKKVEEVGTKLLGKKVEIISRMNSNNHDEGKKTIKKKAARSKKEDDLPLIVQKAIDIFNGEVING